MTDEVLIKVENVSKKFCCSLKRSMLYGIVDISRESRAEIVLINGVVHEISYTAVNGRAPLEPNEMQFFQERVTVKAQEIVQKWIDFFVLHKSITSERITRRLK